MEFSNTKDNNNNTETLGVISVIIRTITQPWSPAFVFQPCSLLAVFSSLLFLALIIFCDLFPLLLLEIFFITLVFLEISFSLRFFYFGISWDFFLIVFFFKISFHSLFFRSLSLVISWDFFPLVMIWDYFPLVIF